MDRNKREGPEFPAPPDRCGRKESKRRPVLAVPALAYTADSAANWKCRGVHRRPSGCGWRRASSRSHRHDEPLRSRPRTISSRPCARRLVLQILGENCIHVARSIAQTFARLAGIKVLESVSTVVNHVRHLRRFVPHPSPRFQDCRTQTGYDRRNRHEPPLQPQGPRCFLTQHPESKILSTEDVTLPLFTSPQRRNNSLDDVLDIHDTIPARETWHDRPAANALQQSCRAVSSLDRRRIDDDRVQSPCNLGKHVVLCPAFRD